MNDCAVVARDRVRWMDEGQSSAAQRMNEQQKGGNEALEILTNDQAEPLHGAQQHFMV